MANGGILRGLGLGEEIDSHSVVMRINEAPTAGYESDVGQRTTIRLATFQHNQYREKADEVVIGAPGRTTRQNRPPRHVHRCLADPWL